MSSPTRSPPVVRSPPLAEAPKESAVVRLFITPITFISFLLSLALVDSRNHHLRTHSHSPNRPAPTTIFGRLKLFLHSLVFKSVPESPYAYVKSPDARERSRSGQRNGSGTEKEREKEPWHWHTKQRHLMKAEMDDAFKVRKWVVIFMALMGLGLAIGGAVFVRWCLWGLSNWRAGSGLPEI
ncbi:uncharacterized protein LY89DRAFT_680814 [Mollisia scopiformis]|uniref:Uncharacterized protein n=1 Tax=Mollisia scopiformis TaxID=149040 RepID=A0A194XSJ0_MOLSC|nr:uncharacterized protein LY89DRAFT_680814 [Mollisia scopiformis]KUJ22697.1 hypothetical protein LY89DRAFT_680814 [Mollisia scopiformis]